MSRSKINHYDGYDTPFATRLRELMESAKIPQSVLAEYVGVTRQAISSYSLGTSLPDIEKFEKIADYFKVSTEYLLGRSDIKKADASKQATAEYLGLSEGAIDAILGLECIRHQDNPGGPYILTTTPKAPLLGTFTRWLETEEFPQLASDMWQMILSTSVAERVGVANKEIDLSEEEDAALRLLWERGHSMLTPSQQVSFYKQRAIYAFEQSLERIIWDIIAIVKETAPLPDTFTPFELPPEME